MSDKTPSWLSTALAFARSVEPREPLPRNALRVDLAVAGLVLAGALIAVQVTYGQLDGGGIVAAIAVSVPLAVRRRYPLAGFVVLVAGVTAAKDHVTDLSFLVVVIAGYSAAVHSRLRGLALLTVASAGAVLADVFWKLSSTVFAGPQSFPGPQSPPLIGLKYPHPHFLIPGPLDAPGYSWRTEGFLVLVALVAIAIVGGSVHAGNRIRRLQAEHEAATLQALETERARIARELHDVVTHNVSVMIVQAGAARQVLASAPGDATQALLAVESSGRAAMSELRHLLGLLRPGDDGAHGDEDLRPQPGLSQLQTLINRTTAAGLPIEVRLSELPAALAPGADLAAYRVVQEALTNVLKHAGKPATTVRVSYASGAVSVDVVNDRPPIPAAAPASVPGTGRGLLGLRERVAVHGGEVEAGPLPGGGWQVRARIPAEDPAALAPGGPGQPRATRTADNGRRGPADPESAPRRVVTPKNRDPATAPQQ